jgi:hypothetical protein
LKLHFKKLWGLSQMLKLLSSNYRSIEHTAGSALSKGVFIARATIGGALNAFLAFADAANAEVVEVVTQADKVSATKVAADALAFAAGEKVYYNVAGAKVSKTTTDPLIGYARKAAVAADVLVEIEFDGSLGNIALNDLSDVVIDTPTNTQALKYASGTADWRNAADAT